MCCFKRKKASIPSTTYGKTESLGAKRWGEPGRPREPTLANQANPHGMTILKTACKASPVGKKHVIMHDRNKSNPLLARAIRAITRDDDMMTLLVHIVSKSSSNIPIRLRKLVLTHEKLDQVTEQKGLGISCPILLSEKDIEHSWRQANAWIDAYGESDKLRTQVIQHDGWVSHENYEEAMRNWEYYRPTVK